MASRNTPEASGRSAKAIHAGLNSMIVDHTFAGTISASTHVNMFGLPPGSRVVDGGVSVIAGSAGASALLSVQDAEGRTYVQSGSANAGAYTRFDGRFGSFGDRTTGSANIRVQLNGFSGATGTASLAVRLICTYLSDLDGD